jgi:hypothetical protein
MGAEGVPTSEGGRYKPRRKAHPTNTGSSLCYLADLKFGHYTILLWAGSQVTAALRK